jgi:hypothetical protein
LLKFSNDAAAALTLWPENEDLQELHAEMLGLYHTAMKREVLNAAADPQKDHVEVIQKLRNALKKLPGDAELQAAIDQRIPLLKAELPRKLQEIVQNSELGWDEAMWHIYVVQELLPGDEEVAELCRRMEYFKQHRLSMNGCLVGVEDLFERVVEGDTNVWSEYNTTPVKDAFGVRHEPYALYRFTATASQTAVWRHWYVDTRTSLRFKVFADRNCTGSGVLEVWMIRSAGDDSRWEKYWTSPVLNRTTNGYEVNISLPEAGCQQLELRLVSHTGTVVMLLDDAYLE